MWTMPQSREKIQIRKNITSLAESTIFKIDKTWRNVCASSTFLLKIYSKSDIDGQKIHKAHSQGFDSKITRNYPKIFRSWGVTSHYHFFAQNTHRVEIIPNNFREMIVVSLRGLAPESLGFAVTFQSRQIFTFNVKT